MESLLGFRRIFGRSEEQKCRAIFETFSSEGPSEFLMVSRARWDEHQRKLSEQNEEEPRRTPLLLRQN